MSFLADILEIIAPPPPSKRSNRTVAERIGDAERALQRIADERAAANRTIAEAAEQRASLLLLDEGDHELDELERKTDLAHRALERAEVAEGRVLARLSELRSEARRQEWQRRRADIVAAAAVHLVAAREARRRFTAMLAEIDSARAAGFEGEAHQFIGTAPPVLDLMLLDRFEAQIESWRAADSPPPPAPPPAPRPSLKPAAKPRPTVEISARPPAPPPRRKPIVDPAPKDGERAIVALRPGIELPDGRQLGVGDKVNLTAAAATELVRSGGAEFAELV